MGAAIGLAATGRLTVLQQPPLATSRRATFLQHISAFITYVQTNDASQQPPNKAQGMYQAYSETVQQILANG